PDSLGWPERLQILASKTDEDGWCVKANDRSCKLKRPARNKASTMALVAGRSDGSSAEIPLGGVSAFKDCAPFLKELSGGPPAGCAVAPADRHAELGPAQTAQ
ncbi:MAG: hypothetical protein V2B18_03770, partial [Pseudomonadota bacterium]